MQTATSPISIKSKSVLPSVSYNIQTEKTLEKSKFNSKFIHSKNQSKHHLKSSKTSEIKTFLTPPETINNTNSPNHQNHIAGLGSKVLVAGSTGGVGQLTTKRLLEIIIGDLRDVEVAKEVTKGVDVICSCVGTTAFPTSRWKDNNGAESTFKIAMSNLIQNTPSDIKRFIFISTVGVDRYHMFPYSFLNLFNAIKYKKMSEDELIELNIPYTILRPSRLTDAPYTSYDLNTLIKGERGERLKVIMSMNDDLSGETSRISIAEAIVQCLMIPETVRHVYSLQNVQGDGPEQDANKWTQLFSTC